MRSHISRWFLFGLLLGWSLTHASVFGQPTTGGTIGSKATPSADKLRQGLEKTITVDFSGQSIIEVVNHLRDRAGVPINVDEQSLLMMGLHPAANDGLVQRFEIKASNEKAGVVLRKFLNHYRLTYILVEGAVLVTSEELAVMRQMRQRVTVDLEAVACKKAVRDLARTHGINLVIDPRVRSDAETQVSLQVENTGIETAIRLLAELANLKAVRMGNVLFITSEQRAKKIREEEPYQFDNPLNPNGSGVPAGGGLGGIALPAIGVGVAPGNPGIVLPQSDLVPARPPVPPETRPDPGDAPVRKKLILPVPPLVPPIESKLRKTP